MSNLRYAPNFISVGNRQFVPVISWAAIPPGAHNESPIQNDMWALEMRSAHGSAWQGFHIEPYIDSRLRMVVDITGRENDEVLNKMWELVNGK